MYSTVDTVMWIYTGTRCASYIVRKCRNNTNAKLIIVKYCNSEKFHETSTTLLYILYL